MRKPAKFKQRINAPLHANLEITGENAAAFRAWREALPTGSHGPAISQWILDVEVAKGVKAQIKILVPNWNEYRAMKEQ